MLPLKMKRVLLVITEYGGGDLAVAIALMSRGIARIWQVPIKRRN